MKKPIAIIAGEPNSISSEIIFKTWKLKKKYSHKPIFVIGSIDLLDLQRKKLKYKFKIKKISEKFTISDLNGSKLPVFDVKYKQKKPFEKISSRSNKFKPSQTNFKRFQTHFQHMSNQCAPIQSGFWR